MKIAGIIGGLGPQSTGLFYEEITRLAQCRKQVEYPRMIINSMSIWEFSSKMKNLDQLFGLLSEEINRIQHMVDFLAMVCNTAHSVLGPLREVAQVPLLAIQEEVVKKIAQDRHQKIGILGTKLTTSSMMYKNELDKYGIESRWLPDNILENFNRLIFDKMLHGNDYDLMHQRLVDYANLLADRGCEGVILGCTEFPLFISQEDVSVPLYPSTQILAESVLDRCLH